MKRYFYELQDSKYSELVDLSTVNRMCEYEGANVIVSVWCGSVCVVCEGMRVVCVIGVWYVIVRVNGGMHPPSHAHITVTIHIYIHRC